MYNKMKRVIVSTLFTILFMSCNIQSLDLSTIDFDKPANIYPLENLKVYRKENQKGHFEVKHTKEGISLELKDEGERVTNYVFMEESITKQLNYNGIMLNPNIGVSVSTYKKQSCIYGFNY